MLAELLGSHSEDRFGFGISAMTLWRWDHDQTLNFPPPIKIRNRKFRSRRQLEETKARMLRDAMAAKAKQRMV